MALGILFQYNSEIVEVRVINSKVLFRNQRSSQFADIDGLKLNKSGVVKEFPDLKENEDWKRIARERFKEKINNMKSEKEIAEYVIKDLSKFGYKAIYFQREGFRPVKIKD